MIHDLNLARDPFVNRRPVLRAAVVLWIVSSGLLAANGWFYWQHFAGQGQRQEDLAELEPKLAEERRQLEEAMGVLEGFDLEWQRDQIAFLNSKIAERVFAWSELFDHLSEVLPRNARIERVTPEIAGTGRSRRQRPLRTAEDEVLLELTGVAEEDDALLVLLDAFFAHERFRRPKLRVESRDSSGRQVSFSMTVVYQPLAPVPAPPKSKQATEGDSPEPAAEAAAAEVSS